MEWWHQPVPVLKLLLLLEVRACLSYPQLILAFSNLKPTIRKQLLIYFFFMVGFGFFWKPVGEYVTFQKMLKSWGHVLITFPLCASIPWCFRFPWGILMLYNADWHSSGSGMKSLSVSRSDVVCWFTHKAFAFLRGSCRNENFINRVTNLARTVSQSICS